MSRKLDNSKWEEYINKFNSYRGEITLKDFCIENQLSKHTYCILGVSHVPFLKEPQKKKEIISNDNLKAILGAPNNSKIGIRDTNIMVILYDTAIRLSELLVLKLSEVNLSGQTLYLRFMEKVKRNELFPLRIKQLIRYKDISGSIMVRRRIKLFQNYYFIQ